MFSTLQPGSGYPYDMTLQPNIAAAAVAAATAQQLQTAAAAPSTIPDQKLSTGYPGNTPTQLLLWNTQLVY